MRLNVGRAGGTLFFFVFFLMPHSFSRNVLIKRAESSTRVSRLTDPRPRRGKRLRSIGLSFFSSCSHLGLSDANGSFSLGRVSEGAGGGEVCCEPSMEKSLVDLTK